MYDIIGADFETHRIEGQNVAPPFVCLAVSCDQEPTLASHVEAAEVENILEVLLNSDDHSVWCNASFDLGVIARNFPDRLPEIWQALEDGRVHDIIIREKLLHLTTHGSLEFMELPGGVNRKLLYGLAALVAHYLDIDISESKKGNEGWRTNFGELQGLAAKDYPSDAWKYATEDALYPEIIYHLQEDRRNVVIAETGVDPFQVEAFRTACDFALFLWTCWGLRVDAERFVEVRDWLQEELKPENVNLLVASGILRPAVPARPYKSKAKDDSGNLKMTKPINESINTVKMRALITRLADTGKVTIKKTAPTDRFPEGQISYDAAWLSEHADVDPVLVQFQHRQALQKLVTTELPRMCLLPERVDPAPIVHPGYDILKRTGRTSSYGSELYPSFNCQNVYHRVRDCYIPREGHWLFSVDYGGMELGTLAQQCLNLFGKSVLADKINAGIDAHAYLGAAIAYNVNEAFKTTCNEHGVKSIDDIYNCFIELKTSENTDVRAMFKKYRTLAKPTGLGFPGGLGAATFRKYAKATYGLDIDLETAKLLREVWKTTYPEMVQYFDFINSECVDERNGPKVVKYLDDDGVEHERTSDLYCYRTPMGLYRAGCDYCAAANGYGLQSPSAEGALLAVFNVTRACFDHTLSSILYDDERGPVLRPICFVHDEILGEVRIDGAHDRVMAVCDIMVQAMQEITPDVTVRVEPALMLRWDKAAEAVYDDKQLLVPWIPPETTNGAKEKVQGQAQVQVA